MKELKRRSFPLAPTQSSQQNQPFPQQNQPSQQPPTQDQWTQQLPQSNGYDHSSYYSGYPGYYHPYSYYYNPWMSYYYPYYYPYYYGGHMSSSMGSPMGGSMGGPMGSPMGYGNNYPQQNYGGPSQPGPPRSDYQSYNAYPQQSSQPPTNPVGITFRNFEPPKKQSWQSSNQPDCDDEECKVMEVSDGSRRFIDNNFSGLKSGFRKRFGSNEEQQKVVMVPMDKVKLAFILPPEYS